MSDSSWFEVISTAIRNPTLDHQRSVYTNRTLRFDYIQSVGFDFDHTLAVYNSKALDDLAEQMVAKKLVAEEGVPEQWLEDVPDPSFARKGLILDLDNDEPIQVVEGGSSTIGDPLSFLSRLVSRDLPKVKMVKQTSHDSSTSTVRSLASGFSRMNSDASHSVSKWWRV